MKTNSLLQYLIIVLAFGAVFASCKKRVGKPTEVKFDSILVEKQIPLLHENDTTLPFSDIKINFIFPEKFGKKEDLSRLQQIFVGTFFENPIYDTLSPQQAIDKYIEDYTNEYQALSNTFYEEKARLKGEMPQWYWYSLNISNKIMFQNDSLLVYAVEHSEYTGGAHGSFKLIYTNIDLNRVVTLSEEDLFVPDYYRPLTEKIINNLMKKYNVSEPELLLEHGFFTIDDIMPNNNFYLNEEGINYTFNQYEIAPYAMGVINVTIPYSELEDILITDGIISRFSPKNEK